MLKNRSHISLKGLLAATALSIGLVMMPASAQADMTYELDTFENVDVDHSGYIENGEYQSYVFGMADWDNDGYLEETEWTSYTENVFDPYELDYDSFTYYDTDGDGFIESYEFSDVPTGDLYDAWDYDRDETIGEDDWDRVTTYYADFE